MESGRTVVEKNNKGFSLIELLVAIALFAIIIIPVFSSFITSAKINRDARQIMMQTDIAQTLMEGFANKSFADIQGVWTQIGSDNLSGNSTLASIDNDFYNLMENFQALTAVPLLDSMIVSNNEITFNGTVYDARRLVSDNGILQEMHAQLAMATADMAAARSGLATPSFITKYKDSTGTGLFISYSYIVKDGSYYIATISFLPAAESRDDKYFTYNVYLCLYDVSDLMTATGPTTAGGIEWTPVMTMETGIANK